MSSDAVIVRLDRFSNFLHVPFEKLCNEWRVQIPPFQREHCDERVQHFLDQLLNVLYEFNEIYNLNPLNIVHMHGEYFILDGQHRFLAYKRLVEEYDLEEHNAFRITVILRDCSTWDEVKSYFSVLNKHYMTPELISDASLLDLSSQIKTHIRTKYPTFLSNAQRPRFPHINLDAFVSFLLERFPDDTIRKLEQENLDTSTALHRIDSCRYFRIKSKGNLFVVHLFYAMKQQQNARSTLPASVRASLWARRFPSSHDGTCHVCAKVISCHDFHAGHKVAVANGGSDRLENLECVCALCNLSMGTMNMESFKARYF